MFAEIRKDYVAPDAPCPLPFVVCTIGRSESQNAVQRPKGFPYHHVLWVSRGEGLIWVAGQARMLSQGEGFFCKKGVPHSYARSGDAFSTRWITFLGGEGALDYYHAPEYFFFRVSASLIASTAELDALCAGSSTVVSRSAAGYSWLTEWLGAEFAPAATPAARVRQFLEEHFAQPLTLEEIGAQVDMSRFALCRYYRESQGITVMEQLKRIRIAKAKQFLRYASCSIEEVGQLCGYDSPSYFGKLFREETGRSPREYRARRRR